MLELRLELRQVTPPVWRLIRVPADLGLDDLHHAIQAVMGWDDFHPHLFEVGDREYGPPPDDQVEDWADSEFREVSAWAGEDRELTVAQALGISPDGFTYVYDFSEDWRVRVVPVAERDASPPVTVSCLDGAHAGPQQESRELDPFTVDGANRRLARARRPRATPDRPAGPGAGADQQLLANLSLAVLMLGSRPTRHGTREAAKSIRPEILAALHEAGLIDSDPQRKSVVLTDAGLAHARRWLKLRSR